MLKLVTGFEPTTQLGTCDPGSLTTMDPTLNKTNSWGLRLQIPFQTPPVE